MTTEAAKSEDQERIIHFEDHGQDFLRWRIRGNIVVECVPFQGWLWEGTLVSNPKARPGQKLRIKNRTMEEWARLKYPVKRVELVQLRPGDLTAAAAGRREKSPPAQEPAGPVEPISFN